MINSEIAIVEKSNNYHKNKLMHKGVIEVETVEIFNANYARSLIEASLDPLVTISIAGKILDVNEASIKVTGVCRQKLIGTDFSDYFTEPTQARQVYQQVFEKGFVADYPLTIKHKNGNLTDVLYNASVFKDDKGNVLGVFAAARDVTLQRQIEDELLKTQERLNAGLKIANIALSEINYITNTVQLSPESAAMYGFPKNQLEATRQQMHDTFHPAIKAELEAQIIIAMNHDSAGYMALEHPIVLPSGEVRWLKVNKQFFYDDSTQPSKPVYSILVSQDITKRKESSQYARSLIEASLDPLVTISATGKILDVNAASVKVTGVPREELIDTDFSNYFTEPQKAQEGYMQVFEKGFVADYPLTIKHKNGNLTDVLYNASVYKDDKGKVLGVFAAARDVTEQKWAKDLRIANKELAFENEEKEKRAAELIIANEELAFQNKEKEKRAQELILANKKLAFENKEKEKRAAELIIANKELAFQNQEKEKRAAELVIANNELAFQNDEKEKRAAELVAANKELLAFTYISSHDLQEPLRKIQTFASLIIEHDLEHLSANGKYNFERMQLAAGRMQQLIDDLLDFSRINTTELIFENIALNGIVDEVKHELKDTIQQKNATIEYANLGYANIIAFQFRQLVYNLISNALKFSSPKRDTIIKIKSEIIFGSSTNIESLVNENKYYHISFTDNGIGFEPHFSDRIFEVFQKLHGKETYAGTGIGLAIVKKIVENHAGIIVAIGELDKAAQFDIYIPA